MRCQDTPQKGQVKGQVTVSATGKGTRNFDDTDLCEVVSTVHNIEPGWEAQGTTMGGKLC